MLALTIGARLGPYENTGLLGAGGMGEVYRARDTRLNRDVALKVLPDERSRQSRIVVGGAALHVPEQLAHGTVDEPLLAAV